MKSVEPFHDLLQEVKSKDDKLAAQENYEDSLRICKIRMQKDDIIVSP